MNRDGNAGVTMIRRQGWVNGGQGGIGENSLWAVFRPRVARIGAEAPPQTGGCRFVEHGFSSSAMRAN